MPYIYLKHVGQIVVFSILLEFNSFTVLLLYTQGDFGPVLYVYKVDTSLSLDIWVFIWEVIAI